MHFALVRKGGIGRLPKIQIFKGLSQASSAGVFFK